MAELSESQMSIAKMFAAIYSMEHGAVDICASCGCLHRVLSPHFYNPKVWISGKPYPACHSCCSSAHYVEQRLYFNLPVGTDRKQYSFDFAAE